MQQALPLAPAMHNMRPGQDATDQNMQQALLMAGHSLGSDQAPGMMLDHQEQLAAGGDGKRGGKRELSTSKRAAQNRQAQRAFRQRKEGHIKKLEEQVRDYTALIENFKTVQAENYTLRDYIINLQSRLIESQGDFPPAPSNIDLRQPLGGAVPDGSLPGEMAHNGAPDDSSLSASQVNSAKDVKSGIDPSLGRA